MVMARKKDGLFGGDSKDWLEWGYWISVRARQRRRALDLTQDEVVEVLDRDGLEMSVSTYSRMESGKVELAKGAALLVGLSRALKCSVTYLIGLTADANKWEPD